MKKNFLLRDIPQELHRELKLAAVRQQITMRELILRLMADHVEKNVARG
ncbi:MAG: toxin-antitoxin system HicB family antitoxin [Deltaproteobacteria bacterium]|nr:toxin-antitoxin system HicB family antitoxin [Deltaproteobacteria bacterium]